MQIVEQSWGRNQEPWLASQGEGLTPKTQREFVCADDQLWEVGPNAHKDVAKYPKLWQLVGNGLVGVPPNRGPCLGERGEGSEWEGGLI